MARPRRSDHNRLALLDEGMRQLAAHGYHGTGIKQILDSVQVPKGSFYNYFESKEAFVAAIVDEYAGRQFELYQRFVQHSSLSGLGKLRAVNEHLLGQFEQTGCREGCLVGTMAAEIGASSALCQAALDRARILWQASVAQLISEAQRAGELRRDLDAERMAEMYWALWEGALVRMRLDGRTDAARRLIDTALAALRPASNE